MSEAPEAKPGKGWVHLVSHFLLVFLFFEVGLALMVFPWWDPVWQNTSLYAYFPRYSSFLDMGLCRGLVSGLGAANLLAGFLTIYDGLRGRR